MKTLKTNLTVIAATAMLSFSLPLFAHAADASAKDGKKTEMTATSADMADGDKIRFKAMNEKGSITVVDLVPMK